MTALLLAWIARLVSGARGRWLGCEPSLGPRIYYANHTSHLDALVIWAALPRELRQRCHMVAAADYWLGGRVRRYLATRGLPMVLINRKRPTRADNPLEPMLAALKNGDALIIFPEGGRQESANAGEFQAGLYHLARHMPEAELIPAYLENLSRILPKGEVLPVPIIGNVTFGSAFRPPPGVPKQEFLSLAREHLLQLRGS